MLRFIPTPTVNAIGVGPFRLHFYALAIFLGVIVALAISRRRFAELKLETDFLFELAIWVIPAGVIGGRLYHLITSPQPYFGAGGNPWAAFRIWDGGMGIWGAVALGVLAAYIVFKRANARNHHAELPSSFGQLLDALTPGLLVAQAIGRWGNWFNGELFGRPLNRFWALRIPLSDRPVGFENFATFHPTFLYESLWCLLLAQIMWRLRHRWANGRLFLLYIAGYSAGRLYFEWLRIDPANHILGLRLNIWVAGLGVLLPLLSLLTLKLRQGVVYPKK